MYGIILKIYIRNEKSQKNITKRLIDIHRQIFQAEKCISYLYKIRSLFSKQLRGIVDRILFSVTAISLRILFIYFTHALSIENIFMYGSSCIQTLNVNFEQLRTKYIILLL